jgi:hypothetical protein
MVAAAEDMLRLQQSAAAQRKICIACIIAPQAAD